jgi:uncharacterized membrane protein
MCGGPDGQRRSVEGRMDSDAVLRAGWTATQCGGPDGQRRSAEGQMDSDAVLRAGYVEGRMDSDAVLRAGYVEGQMDSGAVLRARFVEARSERGGRQRHGAVDSDGVREAKLEQRGGGVQGATEIKAAERVAGLCRGPDLSRPDGQRRSGDGLSSGAVVRASAAAAGAKGGSDRDQGGRESRGAGHEADLSSDTPILQSHVRAEFWAMATNGFLRVIDPRAAFPRGCSRDTPVLQSHIRVTPWAADPGALHNMGHTHTYTHAAPGYMTRTSTADTALFLFTLSLRLVSLHLVSLRLVSLHPVHETPRRCA